MANNLQRLAAILGTAVMVAAFGGAAVKAQVDELPDGPGKSELTQVCTQCHQTAVITQRRRTPEEWSEVLVRMKGQGAMLDDESQAAILAYLDKNLSQPAAGGDPAATAQH